MLIEFENNSNSQAVCDPNGNNNLLILCNVISQHSDCPENNNCNNFYFSFHVENICARMK